MTLSGTVARPLLAGVFIYGGVDALRDPEAKAKAADDVAPLIAKALHLPTTDTVTLVRVNGAVQVLAGSLLAVGRWRRFSALVLAASLVPTTYAGHRFWEEMDDEQRHRQRIQFLKNSAMLGGLILAAGDTGGRPSLPWQARRAAKQAVEATVAAGAATQEAAKNLLGSGGPVHGAAGGAGDTLTRAATTAGAKAKDVAATAATAGASAATVAAGLIKQLSEAAEQADFKADLKEVSRRAARAAEKAQKSELTKKAVKVAKKAQKSELTKKAVKAAEKAQKADLTKQARRAAGQATKKAVKLAQDAELAERASAAATIAAQKAAATVARAKGALSDVSLEQVRERAVAVAHEAGGRVRESLPLAS